MSELAVVWFEEAKHLKIDEAIFLRVGSKKEQNSLALALEKEKSTYATFDALHASQIFINKTLKNMKQYVVIERKYRVPYTAFFKHADGTLSKISINPERNRQISLMIKDKKSRDEIEDALNGLTDNEIQKFYKIKL